MKKVIISSIIVIIALGIVAWLFKTEKIKNADNSLVLPEIKYPQKEQPKPIQVYPIWEGKG